MDKKNASDTNPMTELFGEMVYSYSREEAIKDGVLVDVSETAFEAGIIFPTAVTRAVWDNYIDWTDADNKRQTYQDLSGRLWDVLYMARCQMVRAGKHSGSMPQLEYQFMCIHRGGRGRKARLTTLKLIVGPGDQSEGVVTIMMPNED